MTSRLAFNPLPWVLTPDGFLLNRETLAAALRQLAGIGYTGLQADVPDGFSPTQYADLLSEYGFQPAPSYFGADFADTTGQLPRLERARAAADVQAALGLTEIFIAQNGTPARLAHPAVGAEPNEDRLARVADAMVAAADVFAAAGIQAAVHPHVGSWVETEAEVRGLLDRTAGSSLAFGPDTGHLAWAGADPAGLIRDYRDRVVGVHLKDVDTGAVTHAQQRDASYREAVYELHVWTEPGRGSVAFPSIIELLTDFDGWYVVEVDEPNLPTAVESSQCAYDYTHAQLTRPGSTVPSQVGES